MRISPWKTAVTTLALVYSLSACQDENQIKGIPDDPAPVASAPVLTTAPPVVPTAPTTVVDTTTPVAAATSTTPAPTTTVDIHLQAADIFGRFLDSHYGCQSDPGVCDPTIFLISESEFEQGYDQRRAGRATAGRYLVRGPENRYVVTKVLTVGDGLLSIEVCSFAHDIWKLVDETEGRADDAIIDETFNSVVIEQIYKLVDGQWRLASESLLQETLGADTCIAP